MTDPNRSHRQLVVINVVGLIWDMIGDNTPNIRSLMQQGFGRPMQTVLPAVTCSVQATMLTGAMPAEHGIVGNGWYARDLAEVMFWKQSNHLIDAEKVFQTARQRDAAHTTAKMFWWYNMYADVAWSVTPRPSYPADGRKIPDIYSHPADLRDSLQARLGKFPLFNFWGPTADIKSSAWIADSSVEIFTQQDPSLTLVYLPHLDYNLQRLGPDDPAIADDIRAVDVEAGKIIDAAKQRDADVIVLSEYGITQVTKPIHINRALRDAGLLAVRRESLGWETLDAGASAAFAVADHQVAHVYVNDAAKLQQVRSVLTKLDGVEAVLGRSQQAGFGIDHSRSGDLVAVSAVDAWFTYYFWQDDQLAPDYARTVDIHRKPGYDPVELFVDPTIPFPKLKVARRLARKLAGFRYYMDLIGLDASIVKGSHGRLPDADRMESDGPVFVCNNGRAERDDIHAKDVRDLILDLQFGA
ncbi:alkaline phosphatase family protein [Fuerstiella marisgermanici]|uniref:Phosphonoacetate hydrolase n=1 Tax=Fuerstiella marisgermanici TaxID=1891926 RepID=A0A1P8WFD6_9PLAN|nr:nucleotide pyrophosphatase/phosphodiesterase family protein [Fuerstiella marisgermanici]APZ92782.1 phosphonoacetate hydrolase [Fuerstiella marisgermanici]